MSNFGFYIKSICVVGTNVENATVKFNKGLNVISGPSDTGKSYIFECINYMLGSSDNPKKINEAFGYSCVLMEIEMYSGKTYTLSRRFGVEEVDIYPVESHLIEKSTPKTINLKHDKEKTDNISAFLLGKSGFNHPIYIRTNKKGKTRTLSFRDLPLYVAISEEKVIKSHSPILSGQFTTPTVENSIFKFIVSGVDDSNNNHNQDFNNTSNTKLEGQKELLDRLISNEEEKLVGITSGALDDIKPETFLEEKMDQLKLELENISDEIESQSEIKRTLWGKLEENKSKIIADMELIKRFKMLKNYYDTDLERLSFIVEGNHYFSQLNFSVCPYCNQTIDGKCEGHNKGLNQPSEDLAFSIEVEMNKIKGKLLDLKSTIEQAENDSNKLRLDVEESECEYNNINKNIISIMQPKQIQLKELLNSYIKERDLATEYHLTNKKIEDLISEKKIIENKLKLKPKTKIINNDDNGKVVSAINEFCKYMSKTLNRWKFSQKPEVLFKDGTFFINSKPSNDYGKGYRAIIYSAFAISIMQYCKTNKIPHPGFVVLDSPLTTYKGKKSADDVTEDIQSAFFKDVSLLNCDMQIIIFDNKEPSDGIKQKINYEEFTKDTSNGRYGFFPVK
ncbi:AAA family ATPase [Lederbergia citrea]|uniref:AAA family ATPase n=1 Tax=Lederbergia citrea TaxID=2833581 RepID=UPI001BC997CF|nr:AAA family ATPase [Lederbergia citrea]MBS4178773.1 AAA family ATPase [Lederbergia citrea]